MAKDPIVAAECQKLSIPDDLLNMNALACRTSLGSAGL